MGLVAIKISLHQLIALHSVYTGQDIRVCRMHRQQRYNVLSRSVRTQYTDLLRNCYVCYYFNQSKQSRNRWSLITVCADRLFHSVSCEGTPVRLVVCIPVSTRNRQVHSLRVASEQLIE